MIEEWKSIKGFENYEISSKGHVRNVKTGRILKDHHTIVGYLQIGLCVGGKHTSKYVHRLVAEAFIPNPDKKSDVNHIDEDKENNMVDNLNWMTRSENVNWGNRNEKSAVSQYKQIIVIYRDNTYEEWPSASVVARELGLRQGNIVNVLRGRAKTYHGLRFKYTEGN